MSKRKSEIVDNEFLEPEAKKSYTVDPNIKKHSLDSDEEDNVDEDNRLDADDIEGEEEGISRQDDSGTRMTAFNMREELEEGHFDKDGHFIWNDEKEIRDNWLDNIDWQKIKTNNTKYNLDPTQKGLADDSDSEPEEHFDELETYKELIVYLKPKETINKAIQRLGGDDRKLSSVERLKRKKAGTLNTNEGVIKLTELANKILTHMGNMNVYQETYENISSKIASKEKKNVPIEPELDMYADDFVEKEKMLTGTPSTSAQEVADKEKEEKETMWEFKWEQDNDKIEGPFTTSQMLKWTNEGYFKSGVWVRKHGERGQFYTSNRIDFDLYL